MKIIGAILAIAMIFAVFGYYFLSYASAQDSGGSANAGNSGANPWDGSTGVKIGEPDKNGNRGVSITNDQNKLNYMGGDGKSHSLNNFDNNGFSKAGIGPDGKLNEVSATFKGNENQRVSVDNKNFDLPKGKSHLDYKRGETDPIVTVSGDGKITKPDGPGRVDYKMPSEGGKLDAEGLGQLQKGQVYNDKDGWKVGKNPAQIYGANLQEGKGESATNVNNEGKDGKNTVSFNEDGTKVKMNSVKDREVSFGKDSQMFKGDGYFGVDSRKGGSAEISKDGFKGQGELKIQNGREKLQSNGEVRAIMEQDPNQREGYRMLMKFLDNNNNPIIHDVQGNPFYLLHIPGTGGGRGMLLLIPPNSPLDPITNTAPSEIDIPKLPGDEPNDDSPGDRAQRRRNQLEMGGDEPSRMVKEKPAIYLYPKESSLISVKVNIRDGEMTTSIPDYKDGWNVYAAKNGIIDKQYDYLFYEDSIYNVAIPDEGWVIKSSEIGKWLDFMLPKLGLNLKERMQFKEYWVPKFSGSEYYEVKLLKTETLNEQLIIDPKPDTLIRVSFYFKPLNKKISLKEPVIVTPQRRGFVAVEWGGIMDG